jgi:hypothetical protein
LALNVADLVQCSVVNTLTPVTNVELPGHNFYIILFIICCMKDLYSCYIYLFHHNLTRFVIIIYSTWLCLLVMIIKPPFT